MFSFRFFQKVTGFSKQGTHDERVPHRQNRLCRARSSWEVIQRSPEFIADPVTGSNTEPAISILQNRMRPVVYIALDLARPRNISPPPGNVSYSSRTFQSIQRQVISLIYLFVATQSHRATVGNLVQLADQQSVRRRAGGIGHF